VKALRERVARARPGVVHVQSVISTRFDALLWPLIRRRARVVMTIHNVRTHERIRWDDWTLWRCYAAADAVVVHTKRAAEVARERLPADARIEPSQIRLSSTCAAGWPSPARTNRAGG